MSSNILHEESDAESENAGTHDLKNTIEILLKNGYEYEGSAPSIFRQPLSGNYLAYKKDVVPYDNWQWNYRNDANILLIFEPVPAITSGSFRELQDLGYTPYMFSSEYDDVEMTTPGDTLAIFTKKILGTDIIDGKVNVNIVKGITSVMVKYDSDFDHKNAKKYYEKNEWDEYEHSNPHNTKAATKFMKLLVKDIKKTHRQKKTKPSTKSKGGKNTKRTNKLKPHFALFSKI